MLEQTLRKKQQQLIADAIDLFNEIREVWERYAFYGYRRITKELKFKDHKINRKRVQQLGGIQAMRSTLIY